MSQRPTASAMKERRNTKSTEPHSRTTLTSDTNKTAPQSATGHGIDMKTLLAVNTLMPQKHKKEMSWTNMLKGSKDFSRPEPQDPVLFCDLVKRGNSEAAEVAFSSKFSGPMIKDCPLPELGRKPGHVPVLKIFHVESHRPRQGSDDDGLDNDDLTATDGIIRKPKVVERRDSRRRSYIYEAIKMVKGEFTFNHRTYRPKVQVAYRVPPGQVPQAVVIERVHRMYKKTDINLVCQNLGIELSDLIPPSHFGESSERFYQESMFRNRTRVSGQDKREYIRTGGKAAQEVHADEHFHRPADDSSSADSDSGSSLTGENEEEEQSQHPFAKSKPPFGPQFLLDYFDNEEFDIRSGEDWIRLGLDSKGKRVSPIPAKAFLPMPMNESRRILPALSEVTHIDLLKRTETLDKFRKWILRERYLRRAGPQARMSMAPTEAEMTYVARTTSTVPMVVPASGSTPDENTNTRSTKPTESSAESENHDVSNPTDDDFGAEESLGSLGSGSVSAIHVVDELGELLKQFKRVEKKPAPDETADLLNESEAEEAMSTVTTAQLFERKQDFNESVMELGGLLSGGHGGNKDPDFDPYEQDGYESYVYEYDKMKKVHNYDWRWVDVAVFDYDANNRLYFVRSIFPPYVYAWVNKLYVLMDGEDPTKHGDRIKDAIIRRIESEYTMRYNLYIDCLPVSLAAEIEPSLLRVVLLKTLSTPKLKHTKKALNKIEKELILEWQRTHMKLHFDHIIAKHPKLYRPWIVMHEDQLHEEWAVTPNTKWQPVAQRYEECRTCNFAYKVTRVQKASVIYKPEPYTALLEIVAACIQARKHPFLLTYQSESISMEEYEFRQKEQMNEVQDYLRNEWMESVLSSIRIHLEKIPKSWYNIEEDRWDVFTISKVSNYLTLVRCIMEDTLGFMVEESLKNFVAELQILVKSCKIERGYQWKNDLKTSDFPPPEGMVPPFKLELSMDKNGPKFTHFLSKCPKIMTHIFYSCIRSADGIPDIMPLIMKNLLFGTERFLHSVNKSDPLILMMKSDMNRYVRRGLLPVDIYAQKYKVYLPVWNMDVPTFMKEWEQSEHTSEEIEEAVEYHMAEMNEIDNDIPLTIDICAFRVNIEVVKIGLLKKKKAIYTVILDNFADKLRTQINRIKEEYEDMERRLTNRPGDIEEAMELKHYLETVPKTLIRNDQAIQIILKDYDIFQKFKYAIPLVDTETKWATALGTNRMTRISEDAKVRLDEDFERLLKVQEQDLSALSETVDSITLSVAGLVAFVELDKANEVVQEIKKMMKLVKDAQEQGELLNKRQQIFELPPAQIEALDRLETDIEPFKNLWFTAAEWLKIQENCFKETLDKVDVNAIVRTISDGVKTLGQCIEYFTGSDDIRHIAEEVQHQIEDFKPMLPLIKTLKNGSMRQRHWEEISEICGFVVFAKANLALKKVLDQGIMKHVTAIAAVGEKSTHEAQVEATLDKMQREITKYKIKVTSDFSTGVQIIVMPPDVMQLIDADVRDTDLILESPYGAPFEERLSLWEKRIHYTQENLTKWVKSQAEWLDIQESFHIPDVATKLPTEYKLFLKMERIWRRVLRLVRDVPDVLDIGSNTTLRASIFQFTYLLEKCRKGLEEFMKPVNSDSDENIPGTDAEAEAEEEKPTTTQG